MTNGPARIHPSALVDPGAQVEGGAEVGPWALVEAEARIGAGTSLGAHALVHAHTVIGRDNRIGVGAVLGGAPQDLHYHGEPTRLVVGDANEIGAYVVVSRGTPGGRGETRLGSRLRLGYAAHVGHDCIVEDDAVIGEIAGIAGHSVVGRGAVVGPLVGVHQFVRLGAWCRVEPHSVVRMDVPPFAVVEGNPARYIGLHTDAFDAAGLAEPARERVVRAIALIYESHLTVEEAAARIQAELAPGGQEDPVAEIFAFLQQMRRGVTR